MKIGILTFHCAHNYGAVLQCYALQEYLKSLGHDVYVIDYRPNYIVSHRDYLRFNPKFLVTKQLKLLPKVFWTGLKLARARNRKWVKFNDFKTRHLNLYPGKDFNGTGFDLCIVGSDQVWNKHITGGRFEPLYFGVDFKCPVISYAASTISAGFSENDLAQLSHLLHGLQAVSVREQRLKVQLASIADLHISVVADPTILAGVKPFEALVKKDAVSATGNYLLVYVIHDDPNLHRIAQKLARDNNWKLIEISAGFELKRYSNKIYDAGIEDFVTLFKNAEFVVTNSFHGTAFSLLFSKSFYAVRQHNDVDVRLEQLLGEYGLLERFIEPDCKVTAQRIDYQQINQNRIPYVVNSANFITQQLQSIEKDNTYCYKVTVIIPTYNAERYLSEAIESVLAQTIAGIEILIIDDGSTDKTALICDDYADRYDNVRVIHKTNEGVAVARNTGIEAACGEYILFLDSDDALAPDAVELLLKEAFDNKFCTFVQGAHKVLMGGVVSSSNADLKRQRFDKQVFDYNDYFRYVLQGHMFSVNTLIRRDFLIINRVRYNASIAYLEDALFWIELLSRRPIGKYINDGTYVYRAEVATSATHTPLSDKKILDQINVAKLISGFSNAFYGVGYDAITEYVSKLAYHAYRMICSHGTNRDDLLLAFSKAFPKVMICGTLDQKCFAWSYNYMPIATRFMCAVLTKIKRVK